ncbi:2,3-bisphosphoglycerate-independent phosphoglycerate mutase [Candidatus Peregrinibacteria bacterium]|nr:MAG: 2,3-bisphosphoglycerate-independent phosphoglycerate mutase [Candidatus Peregrinibacteria bacterium]
MKVLLCVLDGFGHGKPYAGNALANANAPFLGELYAKYPWTLLNASGEEVGIPAGTQGGSEVGHLTMGAGRIVLQPLQEIDHSIADGSFFQKPALLEAAAHAKMHNSAFHILGMISDQGIHADLDHCLALLNFAKQQGLTKVYVHGITDGRDVPPKSVDAFLARLQAHIHELGTGKLATLVGRYFAMDRDKNEDRTEVAYQLYTQGIDKNGQPLVPAIDALTAVQAAYASGLESDYYLEPVLLDREGLIRPSDAVVFFNFRTDRAAQLTERFLTPTAADASAGFSKPHFVAFDPYTTQAPVVFPEPKVVNNLGSMLDQAGLKQLRIAETEKYAHVTFFFNSQAKEPFASETRIMIDSPKCASYAEQPEMSALGITNALLKELQTPQDGKPYDFIALNFANLDLVGHSGSYAATVKAVETIDACLARLVPAALAADYAVLITGDHGNAEYMIYDSAVNPLDDPKLDGTECPSHTRNPVPFIVASKMPLMLRQSSHDEATGGLKDVAPTVLKLLQLEKPAEMTGQSLVA